MPPKLRIALISRDQNLSNHLELLLQSKAYQVVTLTKTSSVLGFIYSDPPDLLIADLSAPDTETRKVIRELKADSYFSIIPVLGLVSESNIESFDWENYPLDDFVSVPLKYNELFSRIALSIQRIQRIFDNNPLTKLPGNTSIQHAIEKVLGKPMAVCYVDINNFKPFNDVYGFSKGDDVIRILARIMSNIVKESKESGFVGHIGGDDFVCIVLFEHAETICKTIIANFNTIVLDLFGDEEKAQGYYLAKDRKGQEQKIPLLGIAIAVVPTDTPKMQHYGKVAEVSAELKKLAKKSHESCYVIDNRRS